MAKGDIDMDIKQIGNIENGEEVVAWYFKYRGLTINADRDINLPSHRETALDIYNDLFVFYEGLYLAARQAVAEENMSLPKGKKRPYPAHINKSYLFTFMDKYVADESHKAFETVKNSLTFDPTLGDQPAIDWLTLMLKEVTPTDVAVLKHFIWQVKRKIHELPVQFEMMINFKSGQGAGKTTAVRNICRPLKQLYEERDLRDVLDSRSQHRLAYVYVNLFEELKGAETVDMEALKTIMSARKLSWRMLGKNSHVNSWQNCTFIGTSNRSLAEFLYDPTGMRRFYEMEFKEKGEITVAQIENLGKNAISLWQSVDEHAPPYVLPFLEELKLKQEEIRQQSSVELYFADYPHHLTEECNTKVRDLYNTYNEICQRSSQPVCSLNKFTIKIKNEVFSNLKVIRRADGAYCNLIPTRQDQKLFKDFKMIK